MSRGQKGEADLILIFLLVGGLMFLPMLFMHLEQRQKNQLKIAEIQAEAQMSPEQLAAKYGHSVSVSKTAEASQGYDYGGSSYH